MSYFYWVSLQWEWNHCCSSNNADSFWQSTEWGNRCALSVTFQTLWTRKVAKLCNCQDLIHKFNNVSQEWLIPWLISERGMNLLEKMKFLCFDWLASMSAWRCPHVGAGIGAVAILSVVGLRASSFCFTFMVCPFFFTSTLNMPYY